MKAIINPFLRLVEIKLNDSSAHLNFDDIDEWQGFTLDGKIYDCHFNYESDSEAINYVSVYAIDENGEPDWQWNLVDEVTIKY